MSVLPEPVRSLLENQEVAEAGECLLAEVRSRVGGSPAQTRAWLDQLTENIPEDHEFAVFTLWSQGIANHLSGRAKEARPRLESAARTLVRAGKVDIADRVRLLLIDVYGELFEIAKARRLAKTLERRFRRRGDHERAGIALSNLACVEDVCDRIDRAIELWTKAREELEGHDLPCLLIEANLANAHVLSGRFEIGIAEHRRIRDQARLLGAQDLEVQSEMNLAEAEYAAGLADRALRRWLTVITTCSNNGQELVRLSATVELAIAELTIGNLDDARTRLAPLLEQLDDRGLTVELMRALRAMITIEACRPGGDSGRLQEYRQRLSAKATPRVLDLTTVDMAQFVVSGRVHEWPGWDLDNAAKRLVRCGLINAGLTGIAWAALDAAKRGRRLQAESQARRVLGDRRAGLRARLVAHWAVARTTESSRSGWHHLRAGVKSADRLLDSLNTTSDRSAFLTIFAGLYLDLVAKLVERGTRQDLRHALELVNRVKSSWLHSELGAQDGGEVEDETVRRWKMLRARLATMLESMEGENENRIRHLGVAVHSRIRELELDIRAVEGDLGRTRPAFGASVFGRFSPDALLRCLPEGHLIVEFVVGEKDILVFALTGSQVRAIRIPGVVPELRRLVTSVCFHLDAHSWAAGRQAIARKLSLGAKLSRISDILLAPLADFMTATAVWIAPGGFLHHVPWTALEVSPGTALVDRGRLTVVPGAAVASWILENPGRKPGNWAFVAAGGASLPNVDQELDSFMEFFPEGEFFRDIEKSDLLEILRTREAVHLAGHALFFDGAPAASGLRLHDGYLSVHDLAATPIRSSMVSFGVCSGVRLAQAEPHRYEGFVRALLAAGVRRVIGPLAWVEDHVAALFDRAFFAAIAESDDSSQAFRSAVMTLRERDEHPATWGNFTHYGDLRPWRES